MTDTPDTTELPPSLRFLKGLVITLMITMILGVIAVVATLVTRMPDASPPVLPDVLTLPAGEVALAVTIGKGWFAVVTETQNILVFDGTGKLLQTVPLGGK
jgi:hypothetical protein